MWCESHPTALLPILCVVVALCTASTGCKREEEEFSDPLAAYQKATADRNNGEATEDGEARPPRGRVGVDEQDDPAAPASLPRSNELPGWVKVKPIRMAKPETLARVVADSDLLAALETFQLHQAAVCTYEWPAGVTAEVLFIEAAGPVDSFGVFSLLTHTAGLAVLPQDQSIRTIEAGSPSWIMLGWQGNVCVRLSFLDPGTNSAMQSVTQLFNRIVFSVPAVESPLIFRVMKPEKLYEARVWAVRRSSALKLSGEPALSGMAGMELDERLGLGGQEVLWIASVPSSPLLPEDERDEPATRPFLPKELRDKLPPARIERPALLPGVPNLVWFVQYGKAADAQSAYDRYRVAIAAGQTDRDRNTQLAEPQGLFLAGTWTADVEARQAAVPELLSGLSRVAFKESAQTVAAP